MITEQMDQIGYNAAFDQMMLQHTMAEQANVVDPAMQNYVHALGEQMLMFTTLSADDEHTRNVMATPAGLRAAVAPGLAVDAAVAAAHQANLMNQQRDITFIEEFVKKEKEDVDA